MLVEQPYLRDYPNVLHESYLRNQHSVGNRVMEEHNLFRTSNFQVYEGISGDQKQGWQPTQGCSTQVAAITCVPVSYSNTNLIRGGSADKGCTGSKSEVCRNDSRMKQEVSAFGPKHAEYARRFYQFKGAQSLFQQNMLGAYRLNYGPMEVSNIKPSLTNRRGDLQGEPVWKIALNKATLYTDSVSRQVPEPVAFQEEPVLKVAKISSRPVKSNNSKVYPSFSEQLFNSKMDQKTLKSIKYQDLEDDIDLANAPVFQILCKISKI
jgi:hypothetical protein